MFLNRRRCFAFIVIVVVLAGCKINDPVQKVSVTANVSSNGLDKGDYVDLTWTSDNAKSCSINDSIGILKQGLPTVGKENLTPTADQTYTVSCEPSVKGDKGGSASASVKLFELPTATLEADKAQIYLGDQVFLKWTAQNADVCKLTANGKEITTQLTLTGNSPFSPGVDTSYELLCANVRAKKVSAKTKVSVFSEIAVSPKFETLASLDAAIDTQQMKTDCGEDCAFADFAPDVFWRQEDGSLIGSPQYKAIIEKKLKAEPAKVALFTTKTVNFDFSGSFGYGHRLAIDDAAQQKVCEQKFPLAEKGARFPSEPTFIDELETNMEIIGTERLSPVAYDIEVSGKALRGVMKKGSEATFSYKIGKVTVQKEAAYTDFDKVRGSFKLAKDGSILRSAEGGASIHPARMLGHTAFNETDTIRLMDFRASCSVPNGALRFMKNVDYAVPTTVGYLGSPNAFNPFDELCNKDAYYITPGSSGEPCSVDRVPGIDERPGYVRPGSPRVIAAQGQVQCNQYFGTLAGTYSLGADWVANTEIQYFVTDGRFKSGCNGADCASKEPRSGERDFRFTDVEPGINKCVDRWKGLPWNDYFNRLSNACTSTQLFKDAVNKKAKSDNDAAFALDCGQNNLCKNALTGMVDLADRLSPKTLSDIIDRESAAMVTAKTSGVSYFIADPKLSPQYLFVARASLVAIEAGLEIAQSIHVQKNSGWATANRIVQSRPNVPGFDNYQESKDSMAAYQKQLDRITSLTDLDLREISCGYDARGRFRSYAKPNVSGNVKVEFASQSTVKTTLKEDTIITQ